MKRMNRVRRARFHVAGHFDGARSATVTIVDDGRAPLVVVRPYRRRRNYELLLADVADAVIWRVVRAEAAERRAAAKSRKHQRNRA